MLASIQIGVSALLTPDALLPRALASKRSGDQGCTQSQYLCRGSLHLAADAWPLLCSLSTVYSDWHSVVPVHAHLQQLNELWTLKQMVFLPPLPFFIMPATFVDQGQKQRVHSQCLRIGFMDEATLEASTVLSQLFDSVFVC